MAVLPTATQSGGFAVVSSAFPDGGHIPPEYWTAAAGGRNVSVPLEWRSAPPDTRSFAVEVVDEHPRAGSWTHWLVVDIPPGNSGLASAASGGSMPAGARELANGFGLRGWGGPQPPRGSGPHPYRFTVYALDSDSVDLPTTTTLAEFRAAVQPHTLASASISGVSER